MTGRARVLVLLAVVLLVTVGCGRKPAALYGTWKPDVDKAWAEMKDKLPLDKIPEPQRAEMEKKIRSSLDESTFTFSEGKVDVKFGPTNDVADFKVGAMEGNKWSCELKPSKRDKPVDVTLTWVDDDHMELSLPMKEGLSKVSLTRKK